MTVNNNNPDATVEEQAELLLKQLMHLKQYETPETVRMTRSRQNIMRKVRHVQSHRRKSLGELLEARIPWFFAEPKYGIALLFIAFAALQYVEINREQAVRGTGIYTSSVVALDQQAANVSTNTVSYPRLPDNLQLFPDGSRVGNVQFVEHLQRK